MNFARWLILKPTSPSVRLDPISGGVAAFLVYILLFYDDRIAVLSQPDALSEVRKDEILFHGQ